MPRFSYQGISTILDLASGARKMRRGVKFKGWHGRHTGKTRPVKAIFLGITVLV